jgi:nicotinic acid mononucleotide adenylyltransferase
VIVLLGRLEDLASAEHRCSMMVRAVDRLKLAEIVSDAWSYNRNPSVLAASCVRRFRAGLFGRVRPDIAVD